MLHSMIVLFYKLTADSRRHWPAVVDWSWKPLGIPVRMTLVCILPYWDSSSATCPSRLNTILHLSMSLANVATFTILGNAQIGY